MTKGVYERGLPWTDERVARVKKLWADGLSASQIAKDIGGVTRLAVIGKVHRLGLSGRAHASGAGVRSTARPYAEASAPRRFDGDLKAPSVPRDRRQNNGLPATIRVRNSAGPAPAPALIFGAAPSLSPEPVAPHIPNAEILTPTATVLTLGAHMCKWPIGDPSHESFGFCGRRADGTYCRAHARVAYQPLTKNRTPNELARSLRRYC